MLNEKSSKSTNGMMQKLPPEEAEDEECEDIVVQELAPALLYGVSDIPPLAVSLPFALQICIQTVSAVITHSMLTAKAICAPAIIAARIMNTSVFLSGLTTLLQTTLGVRLPIFQGPSILYIMPLLVRAALPVWSCPASTNGNGTTAANLTDTDGAQDFISWDIRLAEVSGSLMAVSLIHAILGYTGLVGYIVRSIGPMTIAPAITLVGLDVVMVLKGFAEISWLIAGITFLVVIICSCYLANVRVPLPSWNRKRGIYIQRCLIFRPFGIIIAMIIGWLLCFILTETGFFSDDPNVLEYQARTDSKGDVIEMASWFYVPYPGQFGPPSFSTELFFGLIIAMVSSVLDSVADYILASKVCRISKPPPHAVNRGLVVEGACSILSGAFGAGHATTTYSGLIGNLSLTGIGSRRVFQLVGIILMSVGIFGKFGALLVTMPKPIVGGFSSVGMGCMIGMALSSLEEVDLTLPRNVISLGLPLVLGTMIPSWVKANPNGLETGVSELTQLLNALLSNSMFVGGVTGFFLDNTLPGNGKKKSTGSDTVDGEEENFENRAGLAPYDLPFVKGYLRRQRWTRFVPILPHTRKL